MVVYSGVYRVVYTGVYIGRLPTLVYIGRLPTLVYTAMYPSWYTPLCTPPGIHRYVHLSWYTLVYTSHDRPVYPGCTPLMTVRVHSAQSSPLSLGECGPLCAEFSSPLWENVGHSAQSSLLSLG